MHRRTFLGALASLPLVAGKAIAAATTRKRVLVVGAGVAGLAAAKTLAASGFEVVVLEARSRLGGRIATSSQWADAHVDLGASWIHGQTGNPLTALVRSIGMPTVTTRADSQIIYDSNGIELTATGYKNLETLRAAIESAVTRAQNNLSTDQSLRSAIESGVNFASRSAADQLRMNYLMNSDYEQEYGGAGTSLSAIWFDDDSEYPGEDLLLTKGYAALPQYLSQSLDIRYQQTVRRIRTPTAGSVSVETQAGTFTANRAVITLPLGVLKASGVTFDPLLPAAKTQAITRLGMGVLNKCVLRFSRVFWAEAYDWLGYVPSQNGQWAEWISLSRQLQKPILVGFNAADYGRQIESLSDGQIVAGAMATLRKIYGSAIPEPVGYQISRWASDPFALGAYSFLPVGATPRMRDILAASVNRTLFFAGEATHRKYPATVHGAYLSGLRAAQEVMAAG
jgi:monoamine oxidase